MRIAVPKEIRNGETRVAVTPDIVKKYKYMGIEVRVQSGAGEASGFSDKDYREAGADIKPTAEDTYKKAAAIFKIWAPEPSEEPYLAPGQAIFANFQALTNRGRIETFAHLGLTCFALELMPRISRAQSMDILSSQSNLAGYKAVIEAVSHLSSAVPMMMTAAGTVAPAKALILGAGVAGLQAIATAKRLGAIVYASDVRPQVKEQVESLGGKFLEVKSDENFETAGGYAKETSADYKQKQQEAVARQLTQTNFAVTTALIPGLPAPRLITKAMLSEMPAGSVIIDMASSTGGNVEGTEDDKTVIVNGVTIIGNSNLAAALPASASPLFAKNIFNFIETMYDKENKKLNYNFEDELIKGTCLCFDGKIVHPSFLGV